LPKGGVPGHFTINRVFGAGKAISFRPNTGYACDSSKFLRAPETKVRELIDSHEKIQEIFHFITSVPQLRNTLIGRRARHVGYGDMDAFCPIVPDLTQDNGYRKQPNPWMSYRRRS
jgi:hypothetical protein